MKGKKYAAGGVTTKDAMPKAYDAGDSNVVKEAKEGYKRGGRVKKEEASFDGGKARLRLDKPGRKSGGRVGADKSPLSAAANVSAPEGLHAKTC